MLPRVADFDLTGAADKLAKRGSLPGAFGYDLAAHGFRAAMHRGVSAMELLPAAMPVSWMVNSRATSPVFRKWLSAAPVWELLVAVLADGPDAWLEADDQARRDVSDAVSALSIDGHGPCAVSKVLALLVPQTVPLMDDAAIAMLTGAVDVPADDKKLPAAGAEHFVPCLDAFSREAVRLEKELIELARGYELAPLDGTQVLDRLLWFDSWGQRHFRPPTRS